MKICFLTHNLKQDNGAGVFSLHLIDGLKKVFHCEVIALTTEASGLIYEKSILYPKRLKLLSEFFNIRKIIKECDIIHALDVFPYGVIAVLAAFGLNKKIIITAIGTGAINHLYKPFYFWLLNYCYRRANQVVAISNFIKKEILKKISGISIKVVTPGVDLKDFKKDGADNGRFKKYQPYILSVGSLRWRKGYKQSIRSFDLVSKIFPDLKYVIVGKKYADKYFNQLIELIKELHLENKVFILSDVNTKDELRSAYAGAELFCLLSQNLNYDVEGFGLVFLEAAASGLPVVGSKNCGVEDAVLSGENGFLVDSRNYGVFASAIIDILKNPSLKVGMSKKSLDFARASTWESKIKKYIAIYIELIK
jgi:phosphatidylinositol alpha-1,6-mannosyltransferase